MIVFKTPDEIRLMREGGKILAEILQTLKQAAKPGVTPRELDRMAEELMQKFNVTPSFKGYQPSRHDRPFPAVTCINVNEEVVHAIPGDRILKNGDIVSIDCGVKHKSFHTDAAVTVGVGKISLENQKFIDTAYSALEAAIAIVRPGVFVRDISGVIQDIVEKNGYGVVRELIGHGVGRHLHEDPPIPNFREPRQSGGSLHGAELKTGMTIAIEPIITFGKRYIKELPDGWTVTTQDGSVACQVEHSIAVTENGCEILTVI